MFWERYLYYVQQIGSRYFMAAGIFFLLFFFFRNMYKVYSHLGYERYPAGFNKHWLGKWMNTSVNHNQRHPCFKDNYGLYFTRWHRLLGTLRRPTL